ncbi:MAG: hypothetical protein RLZZ241_2173 [Bacteroidota bacterium]|jgi:sugar phosphate isomerase/epimerase
MRTFFAIFLILHLASDLNGQNREIWFFQTDWGNTLSWDAFCARAKASGFDGIDIWLPAEPEAQTALKQALNKYNLKLNLMHGTNRSVPYDESLRQYTLKLYELAKWNPILINSHTGSDFFSAAQNSSFIEAAQRVSLETGIPIYHETHRSRFSYTLPATAEYLRSISELKLTADISHWMVVHESLLESQDNMLRDVLKRANHIHARIGHSEGPQVSDPRAPEWKTALDRHLDLWKDIILRIWENENHPATVTTEFGPPDYMPTLPYSGIPVADQWEANVFMITAIKTKLGLE